MIATLERPAQTAPLASARATASAIGFELTPAETKKLAPSLAEIARLEAERASYAPGSTRRAKKLAMRAVHADASPANLEALRAVHSVDEGVARSFRLAIRERQRELGPQVAEVGIPILRRFLTELGKRIAKIEADEKRRAEELEIPFEPSPELRALIRRREVVSSAVEQSARDVRLFALQLRELLRLIGVEIAPPLPAAA